MRIAVFTLTSPLHDQQAVNEVTSGFLDGIRRHSDLEFVLKGDDFSSYGQNDLDVIFVRTGGTEGLFRDLFERVIGPSAKSVLLLAAGSGNSLAASMEILSFLNSKGCSGEILHGDAWHISGRIAELARVSVARRLLNGRRFGVIGQPSDWLISSTFDRNAVKEKLGVELVDIPVSELIGIVRKSSGKALSYDSEADNVLQEILMTGNEKIMGYADGAMRIYAALKEVISEYGLSGFTLRCFDLLDTVGNTGCLALALLNAGGVPSGCEGDVPALLSMAVGNALTGQSGFQANPSRIDPAKGEMILAHCTVPFNMITGRVFDTHFESGTGVAVHGEIPLGKATLFKLSGDLKRFFCKTVSVVENMYESSLCRTQVRILLDEDPSVAASVCNDYFLKSPIGNHHVLFAGDHAGIVEQFVREIMI